MYKWIVILLIVFSSCSGPLVPSKRSSVLTIEGQLVDVEMFREDSYWSNVLLKFEDGRMQKARLYYNNPVVFHLNEYNVVTMNSSGAIQSVKKKEGITN